MPKKEPAQSANHAISNMTDLPRITNSVFDADSAKKDSYGNVLMLKNATNFLGSNYGSKKAIPSGDSRSFPDTAHSRSSESKIIGWVNTQHIPPTFQKYSTFFTMAPISEGTTVSSVL